MNEELIERLRTTEQMLNVAHFKEAESLIREACDAIKELQSKLTASRRLKKGKWIIDGHHIGCNQCGTYMCDTDREGDKFPTNFCPNCGAEMEIDNE